MDGIRIDRDEIARIVAEVRELVATRYVFPDAGERIAADVAAAAAAGRYADATDPATLAARVTEDLQRHNGDGHLRLIHHAEPIPDRPDGDVALAELLERRMRRSMSGIQRIERLDGNIGLLAIEPLLFGAHLVGDDIAAAMRVVRHTDGLIIDVRRCVGSDPAAVAYFCTYLLPPGTHLMDFYDREGDRTTQYWTLPHVPGPRYGTERPVYVLTSRETFSGGEQLAYQLRHSGRATLVGEVTGGGAHPRVGVPVHRHLEASIPTARPIHPVTGTNWEGVGVEPHIVTPAVDALAIAHAQALTHVRDRAA